MSTTTTTTTTTIETTTTTTTMTTTLNLSDLARDLDLYKSKFDVLAKDFKILHDNTNDFFLIVIAIIIFFMLAGFAFLEAGSVRSKNTVNILIKSFLDSLISGVSYWAMGWAVAFGPGGNGFIGGSHFFSYNMEYTSYPAWFFQYVFAATASTIVSGSVAERCQFASYLVYSFFITGWIYPVVSHWVWDTKTPGFLFAMGYKDFAGSGVVHLLGGTIAIVGCVLIGPRHGRFDKVSGKTVEMPGHSVPLAALGGFILIFGFLAFSGGSQASIANEGDPQVVARAIVNSMIGGCGGGLVVLFFYRFVLGGKWSYLITLNGSLTGMVAMCGGCDVYHPWAALVIGALAGLAFLGARELTFRVGLDDPLDAVPVHFSGGLLGVLAVHFFAYPTGIFWLGHTSAPWHSLGINILGAVIIIAWSAFWSLLLFGPLKYLNLLRVDREVEFRGNDILLHGESAYPAEAWVETQYKHEPGSISALPSNMNGGGGTSGCGTNSPKYNNAFEMVPTSGMLFRHVSSLASTNPALAMVVSTSIDLSRPSSPRGLENEAYDEEEEEKVEKKRKE